MTRALPEGDLGDTAGHLRAFLDFYRATVLDRCSSLDEASRVTSAVPSGWTPLSLLLHLAAMERRWIVWGFLGEPVADPYVDSAGHADGVWRVPRGWGLPEVQALLQSTARRTDEVLATTPLDVRASPEGRFAAEPPAGGLPSLRWIGVHVLQEYARHAGHLDVAAELLGGRLGE